MTCLTVSELPAAARPGPSGRSSRLKGATRALEGARSAGPLFAAPMAAGLVLACLLGAGAEAQSPTLSASPSPVRSLEGRWVMARQGSFFEERVSGPAPDKAVVTVLRDSPDRLVYEVSESRAGEEVAHGAYNLSLSGSASRSVVDGARQTLTAARTSDGAVIATATPVSGYTALIRLRSTGPNTAVLEHEVESASGPVPVDQIRLIRSFEAAR